ncbi:MAG: hypothetical protein LBE18_08790 [Planctomycetaceae bacterium]|jgi:uncharacterized protein (TIGR03546 family)|nr:hypothetical protein [Planctomycetaceae bacterium]
MYKFVGSLNAKEIALSISFGVLLGLLALSSGKLLFVFFFLLFFLSRANLLIGIIVTIIISVSAIWLHPLICHPIGEIILTNQITQVVGGVLLKIPFFAWTMLDNTIVCGAFIIGIVLFIPLFLIVWITLKLITRKVTVSNNQSQLSNKLQKSKKLLKSNNCP